VRFSIASATIARITEYAPEVSPSVRMSGVNARAANAAMGSEVRGEGLKP
jgi:hypothetical protein